MLEKPPLPRPAPAMMFVLFIFLPVFAASLSLEFVGEKQLELCPCEFAQLQLKIAGNGGELASLQAELQDSELLATLPETAYENSIQKIFLKASCEAKTGRKLLQLSANSESESFSRIYSVDVVECHALELLHFNSSAICPDQVFYEMELGNVGKYSEEGEFHANADFGYAKTSPKNFFLKPGEKTSVSLSIKIPLDLNEKQRKDFLEFEAVGLNSVARQKLGLVTPLCPGFQPPAPPQGQLTLIAQAFPLTPPPSIEVERAFDEIATGITGFFAASPSSFYGLLAVMALVAVAFYALSKEKQLEASEVEHKKTSRITRVTFKVAE